MNNNTVWQVMHARTDLTNQPNPLLMKLNLKVNDFQVSMMRLTRSTPAFG